MRTLFTLDSENYTEDMPLIERFGVRALIRNADGMWAMQKSFDGEYKIPGGGVEKGESFTEALCREVREETGLFVIPESIVEIGEVLELRADIYEPSKRYAAHSLYFFCDVTEERTELTLTESEKKRGYKLAWTTLDAIIEADEKMPDKQFWRTRDMQFLRRLRDGKYTDAELAER